MRDGEMEGASAERHYQNWGHFSDMVETQCNGISQEYTSATLTKTHCNMDRDYLPVTRQSFQCRDWDTTATKPATYNLSLPTGCVGLKVVQNL